MDNLKISPPGPDKKPAAGLMAAALWKATKDALWAATRAMVTLWVVGTAVLVVGAPLWYFFRWLFGILY